jgi:hypothetical protein
MINLKRDHGSLLYLIDFGICTSFIDKDGNHVRPNPHFSYKGTPTFSSSKLTPYHSIINPILNFALDNSRKDDFMNLFYLL